MDHSGDVSRVNECLMRAGLRANDERRCPTRSEAAFDVDQSEVLSRAREQRIKLAIDIFETSENILGELLVHNYRRVVSRHPDRAPRTDIPLQLPEVVEL